jgi:hypothetical protein
MPIFLSSHPPRASSRDVAKAGRDAAPAGEVRNLAPGRPGAPPGEHKGSPARSWLIGAQVPESAARVRKMPHVERREASVSAQDTRRRKAWLMVAPLGAPSLGRLFGGDERDGDRAPKPSPGAMTLVRTTTEPMTSATRATNAFCPPPCGEGGERSERVGVGQLCMAMPTPTPPPAAATLPTRGRESRAAARVRQKSQRAQIIR